MILAQCLLRRAKAGRRREDVVFQRLREAEALQVIAKRPARRANGRDDRRARRDSLANEAQHHRPANALAARKLRREQRAQAVFNAVVHRREHPRLLACKLRRERFHRA